MAIELFPERDCARCTDRLKDEYGCFGNAKLPVAVNDEELATCIRRPLLDDPGWFNEAFTVYNMYKAGFLPHEGSYLSQPLSFLQLINIIEATLSECGNIKEQKDTAKQARERRAEQVRSKHDYGDRGVNYPKGR